MFKKKERKNKHLTLPPKKPETNKTKKKPKPKQKTKLLAKFQENLSSFLDLGGPGNYAKVFGLGWN